VLKVTTMPQLAPGASDAGQFEVSLKLLRGLLGSLLTFSMRLISSAALAVPVFFKVSVVVGVFPG